VGEDGGTMEAKIVDGIKAGLYDGIEIVEKAHQEEISALRQSLEDKNAIIYDLQEGAKERVRMFEVARKALEKIVKHHEYVAGTMAVHSTVCNIAKLALSQLEKK
jgi:hypothetical protein